ncbi:MAG: pyrroloquinoline quinone biosynthesis protein PqqB [Alphaproteobacteria bacterium]|nr:pyrroloquinoline quinone biosynthesis protein PqqB [Alphaproteobacteria bacterium]
MNAPFLVVLGVAQDAGHPQAGCERSCCRPAWEDPSRAHLVTSLGLVDPRDGRRWIFDASPDLPRQLRHLDRLAPPKERPPDLAGVFLTHAHIGHYTGLVHLGREVMGASGVPLYAMPRMRAFIEASGPWELLVRLGNVSLQTLTDGQGVRLADDLVVTPFAVPHRGEYSETVGFRIRGPGREAVYLPDIDKWSRWSVPVERLLAEVDLAYVDATFYADGELPGRDMAEIPHPFVQETLARLADQPAALRAKVRFIHLNHTNPLLDPDSAAQDVVRSAGMRVAEEGEVFAL